MKKFKKVLITLFAFLFAISLGVVVVANSNLKAEAATGENVTIDYACVQYSATDGTGYPTTYTFVTNLNGESTSSRYDTFVYFNGQKMDAWMQWGCFYVDHSAFNCEVGDVIIVEIPAGTYYQTDKYVANDIKLFCVLTDSYTNPDHGSYNKQAVFDRVDAGKIISNDPYALELYRVDWAMNATNANNLYLRTVDPNGDIQSGTDTDWKNHAKYSSLGNAITLNGNVVKSNIEKVYAENGEHKEGAFVSLSGDIKAGDVLTFNGWFYNEQYGAFKIEDTSFIYDGKSWDEVNSGTYTFDVSTTSDANPQKGFYLSMTPNHIPISSTNSGWSYSTDPVGTAFYGYYNSTNVGIRFRKFSVTDWYVALSESSITATQGDVVSFGGWYVCKDEANVKHFIKINTQSFKFDGTKWTEVTPEITVSLNGNEVEGDTIVVNPGQSASDITATSSNGNEVAINFANAVSGNKFVLRSGESQSDYFATFSVKDANNTVYRKQVAVKVGFSDFVMENGAAVRTTGDDVNGLRFSAEMSEETYNSLTAQGATFGMVIVPRDYITSGYELTVSNLFGTNAKYSKDAAVGVNQAVRRMLLIEDLYPNNKDNDSNYEIYGSITDILTNNLTREFVGVAYAYVNGDYVLASFYGDDMENNARSIYYVAQKAIDANDKVAQVTTKYINAYNTYLEGLSATYNVSYTVHHIRTKKGVTEVETENLSAPLNSTVEIDAKEYDGFALTGVAGVTIKLYANKENVVNFYYKDVSLPDMDVTAWHHPKLDATNDYMNDTNKAIAETMANAGFTSVMLNGSHTVGDFYLNSPANITAMKNIINMFWEYGGIKTYVSAKNASDSAEYVSLEDYQVLQAEMATLTDCEGFGGFFAWDEPVPTTAAMNRLAEYAVWFDDLYGDEATFMVNLLPSYYDGWSSGDYNSYSKYIEAYCETVLSKITVGEKYLSMDSYPIYADGTLMQNFMYDLAVLKHYSLEYDAIANAILQGCGWGSANNTVVPTEAQYRFMLYTALAFGMDSIGWWGYSPESDNPTVILPGQTPVDINNNTTAAYNSIKNVNDEVQAFNAIYLTYEWQGVIMSSPSAGFIGIGKDAQYDAFNKVKSDSLLSKYMLSASNTNSFSSISGSGSNYVVGVMKDNNNNEAFTVVNYSAVGDNKTLSITFKAKANGNYKIYTSDGATTVNITTSGYTLKLAPGEGAFIMSANTTHSVTFKDWDGTVLYETTCQIGNTPVYGGAEPNRDGYTFTSWTPALGAITGDTVYTATYKGLPTITFKNWDGEILQQSTWAYGSMPTYSGATPTKEGCEFTGWTPAITTATGDATYTATFDEIHTVTFENWNGTNESKADTFNDGASIGYVPTLDGYVFAGWLLDGELFTGEVNEDLTLVASWYKVVDGVDSVYSATDVKTGVQLETGYGSKEEDATTNPNASWYFDSDYNGNTGANGTVDNQFAKWVKFTLTYDGGAGTSDTGRETYLILPAINYKLYSKVDFAYANNGNIKALTIYGTEVAQFGGNNKLISIVTDENGTKLYFREINSVHGDVTVGAHAVIVLPESVANGTEGLRFNITVGGWFKMSITEFHMTSRILDYMANLQNAIDALEENPSDVDALETYLNSKTYFTEYELANYTMPNAVAISMSSKLASAVENANGNAELVDAIDEYKQFYASIDDLQELESIQMDLAKVNSIVYKNFYELAEEEILLNDPIVDTSKGAVDQDERIQTGWGGHSTDYNTAYETYVHMIQYNSDAYDGTITLPAINYNSYVEAYFGLRAITADGMGTVTIGSGSKSFDNSKNHNWKITIVGNTLTVADDNKSNNDGGGVLFTTILSDAVANGQQGLVIDCNFEAWSQVEVTEMHVLPFEPAKTGVSNVISITQGGQAKGEKNLTHAQNSNSKFKGTNYETFSYRENSSGTADVIFTLGAFDYSAYDEVRFGVAFAVTGTEVGTITINGATLTMPNALIGHFYKMEAVVANGWLTLVDAGSTETVKTTDTNFAQYGYFLKVQLSDAINKGNESLVVTFGGLAGKYAWMELTEMHASVTKVLKDNATQSSVVDNAVTAEISGTTVGSSLTYNDSSYWGTGAHTAFNTSYTKQNLVSFNAADSAYTVAFTLPTFNFSSYDEAYFGFTAATAAGTTTVTINGQSYTYDLNAGYLYVKMLVRGNTLTVVGDGANNAGTVYMSVELPANVLNGNEGLVITWSTAGWSQVEITEMHALKVVKEIK